MGRLGKIWGRLTAIGLVLLWGRSAAAAYLRHSCGSFAIPHYLSTRFSIPTWRWPGSLIAFTFAANAMVRFRGTHDRISLILAFGFVLAGLIEAGSSMTFYRGMLVAARRRDRKFRSDGWPGGRCWACCCWPRWWSKGGFRSRAIPGKKSPASR